MLQPVRIGHVVLKVRDLDRSLAFYRDLLGFRVSSEMSNVMTAGVTRMDRCSQSSRRTSIACRSIMRQLP